MTAVRPQGSSPSSHRLQQRLARPGEARSASVIHSRRHRFTLMPPVLPCSCNCFTRRVHEMENDKSRRACKKKNYIRTQQTICPFLPLLPEGLVPTPRPMPRIPTPFRITKSQIRLTVSNKQNFYNITTRVSIYKPLLFP